MANDTFVHCNKFICSFLHTAVREVEKTGLSEISTTTCVSGLNMKRKIHWLKCFTNITGENVSIKIP
jgi:hypothetical protein